MNAEGLGIVGVALYVLSAIGGAIASAWWVWSYAPQVGGEFWPYIRAVAAIVAFVIGAKVAALIAMALLFLAVGAFGVLVTVFD